MKKIKFKESLTTSILFCIQDPGKRGGKRTKYRTLEKERYLHTSVATREKEKHTGINNVTPLNPENMNNAQKLQ